MPCADRVIKEISMGGIRLPPAGLEPEIAMIRTRSATTPAAAPHTGADATVAPNQAHAHPPPVSRGIDPYWLLYWW